MNWIHSHGTRKMTPLKLWIHKADEWWHGDMMSRIWWVNRDTIVWWAIPIFKGSYGRSLPQCRLASPKMYSYSQHAQPTMWVNPLSLALCTVQKQSMCCPLLSDKLWHHDISFVNSLYIVVGGLHHYYIATWARWTILTINRDIVDRSNLSNSEVRSAWALCCTRGHIISASDIPRICDGDQSRDYISLSRLHSLQLLHQLQNPSVAGPQPNCRTAAKLQDRSRIAGPQRHSGLRNIYRGWLSWMTGPGNETVRLCVEQSDDIGLGSAGGAYRRYSTSG